MLYAGYQKTQHLLFAFLFFSTNLTLVTLKREAGGGAERTRVGRGVRGVLGMCGTGLRIRSSAGIPDWSR